MFSNSGSQMGQEFTRRSHYIISALRNRGGLITQRRRGARHVPPLENALHSYWNYSGFDVIVLSSTISYEYCSRVSNRARQTLRVPGGQSFPEFPFLTCAEAWPLMLRLARPDLRRRLDRLDADADHDENASHRQTWDGWLMAGVGHGTRIVLAPPSLANSASWTSLSR